MQDEQAVQVELCDQSEPVPLGKHVIVCTCHTNGGMHSEYCPSSLRPSAVVTKRG